MTLAGLNYRCLMLTLPAFLSGVQPAGTGLDGGAVLVFFTLLAGGLGQYLGGWAADRFGARRVYPLAIAAVVPLAAVIASLADTALVGLAAGLLCVTLFTQQPMENSLLAEWTSAGRRGLTYGTKLALTFGVGALGAKVAGLIWEESGSPAGVFLFLAGTAALMTVLALTALAGRAARRQSADPAPAG
jgi:MFS family permease